MGKIIRNGIEYSGSYDNAISINYNNTNSGLNATTVQEGIDEIKEGLKPHANVNPVANLLTTEVGYALDATQGKVLDDKISAVSDSLGSLLLLGTYTQNFEVSANGTVSISVPITVPNGYTIISVTLECPSSYVSVTIKGISTSSISILAKSNYTSTSKPDVKVNVLMMKTN